MMSKYINRNKGDPEYTYEWGFRTGLHNSHYPQSLKQPWHTLDDDVNYQKGLKAGKEQRMINFLSGEL